MRSPFFHTQDAHVSPFLRESKGQSPRIGIYRLRLSAAADVAGKLNSADRRDAPEGI